MMWIWYLLLGSGSGSQTVGEYLKQAGTKVTGLGFFVVTEPIRSAPLHSRLGRRGARGGGHAKFFEVQRLCCKFFVPLLDEFKLVGALHGRAQLTFPSGLRIFPGRKVKVAGALFLEVLFKKFFFLSLSNPFLMERVPCSSAGVFETHRRAHAAASVSRGCREDELRLSSKLSYEREVVDRGVLTCLSVSSAPPWQLEPGGARRNVSLHGTPSW